MFVLGVITYYIWRGLLGVPTFLINNWTEVLLTNRRLQYLSDILLELYPLTFSYMVLFWFMFSQFFFNDMFHWLEIQYYVPTYTSIYTYIIRVS